MIFVHYHIPELAVWPPLYTGIVLAYEWVLSLCYYSVLERHFMYQWKSFLAVLLVVVDLLYLNDFESQFVSLHGQPPFYCHMPSFFCFAPSCPFWHGKNGPGSVRWNNIAVSTANDWRQTECDWMKDNSGCAYKISRIGQICILPCVFFPFPVFTRRKFKSSCSLKL